MKNRKAQYYQQLATELTEPSAAREMFAAARRIEELSSKNQRLFGLAKRSVEFLSGEYAERLSRFGHQLTEEEYGLNGGGSLEQAYWEELNAKRVGWELAEEFHHISRLTNCYQQRIHSICELLRFGLAELGRLEELTVAVEQWQTDVTAAIHHEALAECFCGGMPPLCNFCQAWLKKSHERERSWKES